MSRGVRVRMYDVGFGDAFAVTFRSDASERVVLLDCGSIKAGARPMAKVVKDLIADLPLVDGRPRIDLLVATHRHKDHVSGFEREEWAGVDVREVWMPWTEHPTDPEARRIRETQASLAAALDAQLGKQSARELAKLGLAPQHLEIVANALSNAKAMQTLHHGFFQGGGTRRFLPAKTAKTFTRRPAVLGGAVRVHVLGPTRDELVIRDMDPPSGQSYLAAFRAAGRRAASAGDAEPVVPFDEHWARTPKQYASGAASRHLALDAKSIEKLKLAAEVDVLEALVGLDSAVNGTSLMLVFEFGGLHLLFPGDAQWGTWNAAMEDPRKRALLELTRFLKIGHHGSHNATPRTFVREILPERGDGMASVRPISQWPNIPRGPLLDALGTRHMQIARSDEIDAAPARFTRDPDRRWIEVEYEV